MRLANPPSARDYLAQLFGLIYWSVYSALPTVKVPVLVMHGLQDALIPPANAHLIASQIPQAKLIELPDASHWLMTDSTAACLQALRQHLNPQLV